MPRIETLGGLSTTIFSVSTSVHTSTFCLATTSLSVAVKAYNRRKNCKAKLRGRKVGDISPFPTSLSKAVYWAILHNRNQ